MLSAGYPAKLRDQLFIRLPDGSNSAPPTDATVAGKLSFMYITRSRSPTQARSTGR